MATSRVFYGWWVTLAFATMVFLSTGIRFVVGPFLYGSRALVFAALFLIRHWPSALMGVALLGGLSMAGSLAMSSALAADIFGRLSGRLGLREHLPRPPGRRRLGLLAGGRTAPPSASRARSCCSPR